jgi:hypothetical protein
MSREKAKKYVRDIEAYPVRSKPGVYYSHQLDAYVDVRGTDTGQALVRIFEKCPCGQTNANAGI